MNDDVLPEPLDLQHKQRITTVFETIASGYDNPAMRFFAFAAGRAVSVLKPAPGDTVLDIATGTGAVANECAQAVLPGGQVLAIDLSEAMLTEARKKTNKLGLTNIEFINMDAERLDFSDHYFDHCVCSFGLFFIPDMASALRQWKRVVKPGGTVLFTSFSDLAFSPMSKLFIEQLKSYGVQLNEPPLSSHRLTDPQVCQKLLQDIELESIKIDKFQVGYHLPCVDDWWSVVWNSGMRGMLQKLPEYFRDEFKAGHLKSVEDLVGENGLWLDVEIIISQGKVPRSNSVN